MISKAEQLEYMRDVKSLKSNPAYIRMMKRNAEAIQYIYGRLVNAQPDDSLAVAKLQAEADVLLRWKREYDECENIIFVLENENKPAINPNHDNGLVPPK